MKNLYTKVLPIALAAITFGGCAKEEKPIKVDPKVITAVSRAAELFDSKQDSLTAACTFKPEGFGEPKSDVDQVHYNRDYPLIVKNVHDQILKENGIDVVLAEEHVPTRNGGYNQVSATSVTNDTEGNMVQVKAEKSYTGTSLKLNRL